MAINKYADISKTGNNLVNINAVMDAVHNILNIRTGEIPFNRGLGSRIEDYLFMNMSFSVTRLILSELISSISKWDNRVQVTSASNVTADYDNRTYSIYLQLQVVGLDTPVEMTIKKSAKGQSS